MPFGTAAAGNLHGPLRLDAFEKVLDQRCLTDAWLAGDERWVNWLVQRIIQTEDDDRPKLASAMPMFREAKSDPAFFAQWPYPKMLFRLAQHLLKTAIGSDAEVADSAQALVERLDALDVGERIADESLVGIILMKLLFDAYGYGRIPGWFNHLRRFAQIVAGVSSFREVSDRVMFESDADPTGYLFVAHAARLPGVPELASLFDALNALSVDQRQVWLDAMNEPSVALGMMIDNAWLKETQRDSFEPQATADTFGRLGALAIDWEATRLAGRCYRAQAIVLDEYVNDKAAAYAALDAAADQLPGNYDIERERGKIAWRSDDYPKAFAIFRELEWQFADVDELDAAFALREAAISAAETGEALEAARLFDEAHNYAIKGRDGALSPLSVGLAADAAAQRFGAGEELRASRAMAAVLHDLSNIDPAERPTAHSVHLFVKHLILWMQNRYEPLLVDGEAPFYPPGTASNPDPKAELANMPVIPLAPAWMLLARVALRAGVPVDEVIAWPGLIATRGDANLDAMVRFDLLDHSIASGNLEDFKRFLVPAVESFVHMEQVRASDYSFDPRITTSGFIPSLSAGALMEGRPRDYLRDAGIAQAIVAIGASDGGSNYHLPVHGALVAAAGYDPLPEWAGLATNDPNDHRQIVAHAIAAVSGPDALRVEQLFIAHMRLLEWARRSNHQKVALPALARRVRADWKTILAERRALLIMPTLNGPAIETALARETNDGVFVARVLLAAEPSVSLDLADDMRDFLISVRDGG